MATIDDFLFEILDIYDGFKMKSTLSEDEARKVMAKYALCCMHNKEMAQEAWDVASGNGKKPDEKN